MPSPNTHAETRVPHFDVVGLIAEVKKQDLGLIIDTNNARYFKVLMGNHARQVPSDRIRIFQDPDSADRLWLLRADIATERLPETPGE